MQCIEAWFVASVLSQKSFLWTPKSKKMAATESRAMGEGGRGRGKVRGRETTCKRRSIWFCIELSCDVDRFAASCNVEGKATGQCPSATSFWREKSTDADSDLGLSAYQTRAQPPGKNRLTHFRRDISSFDWCCSSRTATLLRFRPLWADIRAKSLRTFRPKALVVNGPQEYHHHHQHQSLNRKGRLGTTDDISQPVSSILLCSPLPSGAWPTPGLSIPWCCLPTSSSVCLVFFPLSTCLARWCWPDLMNGRQVHTTAVCVSLRSSGGLRVVRLPAGSRHGLLHW